MSPEFIHFNLQCYLCPLFGYCCWITVALRWISQNPDTWAHAATLLSVTGVICHWSNSYSLPTRVGSLRELIQWVFPHLIYGYTWEVPSLFRIWSCSSFTLSFMPSSCLLLCSRCPREIYRADAVSRSIPATSSCIGDLNFRLAQLKVRMHFCYISPSKPATAQSPGSVCHTTLHKRLDLCSSWCSKCAVIAQSHMDWGVFIVSHQIYSSAVYVIMMLASVPQLQLSLSQPLCMLFKAIVKMPIQCLHTHTHIYICLSEHFWLIGGNAFVLWCDWASAVISAVMTHAGRCYRSRFGGAILLTRSLLRQAASNTAQRCVISSKACLRQTVSDLRIALVSFFLFLLLLLNITQQEK